MLSWKTGANRKNGFFNSTGGRKAKIISIKAQARIALGVEIRAEGCTVAAVDLYGTVIAQQLFEVPFQNRDEYFIFLCKEIDRFIGTQKIPSSKILGLGIIMQALISDDGQRVTYGKILDCTGLDISFFRIISISRAACSTTRNRPPEMNYGNDPI